MKKISLIFLITYFLQIFSTCNNCNNKQTIKNQNTNNIISMNSKLRPPFNKIKPIPKINSASNIHNKLRPSFKPNKPQPQITQLDILNAPISVAYGSTDKGLLSFTNSSGQTIVIGTSNANATGTKPTGNAQNFALASYNSNGQLNTSFGTKGVTITDFLSTITAGAITGSIDIPTAFSVLSNGKIIVAGSSNALAGATADDFTGGNFALARYNSNGKLDTSFGTGNGTQLTDIADNLSTTTPKGVGSTDIIVTMTVLNNQNIIVAGNTNFNNFGLVNSSFAIASYNSSGILNTSFGKNGIKVINFALTLNPASLYASTDILTGMTILSNNKIMLYGYSNAQDPNFDFAVARLNPNGQLDTSFNGTGLSLTNISSILGT